MQSLPLFLQLQHKPCLLIGGADAAAHKLNLLLNASAQVTIVAPSLSAATRQRIDDQQHLTSKTNGQVTYVAETFNSHHLQVGAYLLIVDASECPDTNQQVCDWANHHNQLLNTVDRRGFGNSSFAAIVDRWPLTIAISSAGQAPMLARLLRERLEAFLPQRYGDLAALVSRFRDSVNHALPDLKQRRRFWDKQLHGSVGEQVLKGNPLAAEQQLTEQIDHIDQQPLQKGEVFLVGAGPGDPELLTIKALRLMQQADVVLYDRLVSDAVLNKVRREAEKIYVGKNRNQYSITQANINQHLRDYALQGLQVLRLKGGDPFIFGRGGEELTYLAEHNISFQVVPGITAASGCASYAGIPLTHRDHAQSVRFITGHRKNDQLNLNWKEFVEDNQTLVFYMGLNGLEIICQQLIAYGMRSGMPIALVEKGTSPNQRVFVSTLEKLPIEVRHAGAEAPTLIIVGEVVSLHHQLKWYQL